MRNCSIISQSHRDEKAFRGRERNYRKLAELENGGIKKKERRA